MGPGYPTRAGRSGGMGGAMGTRWWVPVALGVGLVGCAQVPITGTVRTDARVAADARLAGRIEVAGPVKVDLPLVSDPGPLEARVVRPAKAGGSGRVALIDLDGLILNQNLTGPYSLGQNPVAAFREKLEAAAADPAVRGVVLRVNSPGGGVTACDILAEELRRFRAEAGKPVVACLMDVATAGAYYVAAGADRVVAHPTTVTGGVGALFNHYNLLDAMAQLNVTYEPVKSGELVDLGSVAEPLSEEARGLIAELVDGYGRRFRDRVAACRPGVTAADLGAIADGRVVAGPTAERLHLVDRLGYLHDAIGEAEGLAGAAGAEVVMYQPAGSPARSLYGVAPNTPLQGEFLPLSYPGLDRSKLPTFLYLWQPDPTVLRQGGR